MISGFHGKLPVTGDFLTRGLPSGFAAFWDGWAARHLTGREAWPEGGLRLRLASGGKVAVGVVIPGADRVGRRFPLAGFAIAETLPEPEALDPWCDGAQALLLAAQVQLQTADDLDQSLALLPLPDGQAEGALMQLWTRNAAPMPCDPAAPEEALIRIFSCS